MPNWVYNSLCIDGADVNKCVQQLGATYERQFTQSSFEDGEWVPKVVTEKVEQCLSFWNIIKPSDDIMDDYINQGWYDWNVKNWGTKWDVSEPHVDGSYDESANFVFSTAWSPPLEAIETLSRQYPKLKFSLYYEEEQGWGGEITFANGEVTYSKEWDIPDSHAENEAIGRSCVCDYDDDDTYWFDDCKQAQEGTVYVLSANS